MDFREWILRTAERSVGAPPPVQFPVLTKEERKAIYELYTSNVPREPISITQSCNMCWLNSALNLMLLPRSKYMSDFLLQKTNVSDGSESEETRRCVDALFVYCLILGFGGYSRSRGALPTDKQLLSCLQLEAGGQDDMATGLKSISDLYKIQFDEFKHVQTQREVNLATDVVLSETVRHVPLSTINAAENFSGAIDAYSAEHLLIPKKQEFSNAYEKDVRIEYTAFYDHVKKTNMFESYKYTNSPLLCSSIAQEVLLPCFFSSRMYAEDGDLSRKDRRFRWEEDKILVCSNADMRAHRLDTKKLGLMLRNWMRLVEELASTASPEPLRSAAQELSESLRPHAASLFHEYKEYEQAAKSWVSAQDREFLEARGILRPFLVTKTEAEPDATDEFGWMCFRSKGKNKKFFATKTTLHDICAAARVFEFPARIACMQNESDREFVETDVRFSEFVGHLKRCKAFRKIGVEAMRLAGEMRLRISKRRQRPWYDVAMLMSCIQDRLVDVTDWRLGQENEIELTGIRQENALEDLGPMEPGAILMLNVARPTQSTEMAFESDQVSVGRRKFILVGVSVASNRTGREAGHWTSIVRNPGKPNEFFILDSIRKDIRKVEKERLLAEAKRSSLLLLQVLPGEREEESSREIADAERDLIDSMMSKVRALSSAPDGVV